MTPEAPVACSLSPADLSRRLADARALGADALAALEVGDNSATLRFRGERERVERLAGAEERCCSFLDIEVSSRNEATELRIGAPPGGEPAMRSLVAAVVAGWEGGL